MELDTSSQTLLPVLSKKKWRFISRLAIPPLTKISKSKAHSIRIRNYTKKKLLPLHRSRFDSVNPEDATKRTVLPTNTKSASNNTFTQTLNKTVDCSEPTLSLYTKLKNKIKGRIKILHSLKSHLSEGAAKGAASLARFTEMTPAIRKRVEENADSLVDRGLAELPSFWQFRAENSEAFMSPASRLLCAG